MNDSLHTPTTLQDFLQFEDLDSLCTHYGGDAIPSVLETARKDWSALARAASTDLVLPDELEPLIAERDGKTYAIYGVLHGVVGGDGPDYREFVGKGIANLSPLVLENGLNRLYPCDDEEVIPDFSVIGLLGGLWMGIQIGISFPFLIWEAIKEWRGVGVPEGPGLAYGIPYHAASPEIRRGFEPDPALPTRLEIADAFRRSGWRARRVDPFAIVERSLFMAGYAVGVTERTGADRIHLLVGDRHTTEIALFLEEGRYDTHHWFVAGHRFASLSDGWRHIRFFASKATHLISSATAGAVPLVAFLVLVQWWFLR